MFYKVLNILAYIILFGIGGLLFVFALISGADIENGGVGSIIQNSPNSLPWLALILLTVMSFKYKLISGIAISIYSLWMIYFFNFSGPNFFPSTFVMTILVLIGGVLLIISSKTNIKQVLKE